MSCTDCSELLIYFTTNGDQNHIITVSGIKSAYFWSVHMADCSPTQCKGEQKGENVAHTQKH